MNLCFPMTLLIMSSVLFFSCQSTNYTTIDFSDGSYTGEIDSKGRKHGKGVYKWLDGSTYEGDFKKDLRHGNGLFKWSNGESYKGDYLEDERTGQGLYTWPDGSYYEGSFLVGKRHGQGTYYSADGTSYFGNWFDDLQHGEGTLSEPERGVVKSIWKNGKIITKPSILPESASKPTIQKSDFSKPQNNAAPAIESKDNFSEKTENERLKTGGTVTKDTITAYNETNTTIPVIPEFEQKDSPSEKSLSEEIDISSTEGESNQIKESEIEQKPSSNSVKKSDSNIWTGTVTDAEKEFFTELINGIDTVKYTDSKLPFTGKMQILNSAGTLIGEVNLLNGQLHGEEIFINEAGVITEKNIWKKGVRVN